MVVGVGDGEELLRRLQTRGRTVVRGAEDQGLSCELVRRAGVGERAGGICFSCPLTHLDTQSVDNRIRIQLFKALHLVGTTKHKSKTLLLHNDYCSRTLSSPGEANAN